MMREKKTRTQIYEALNSHSARRSTGGFFESGLPVDFLITPPCCAWAFAKAAEILWYSEPDGPFSMAGRWNGNQRNVYIESGEEEIVMAMRWNGRGGC
jgi:hypothetical protein